MISAFDHVQLAAPPGSEDALRAFYVGALGMREQPKPASLPQVGCWFEAGAVRLHLGIEEGHRPSAKAHPGIAVSDIDQLAERLTAHGTPVTWDDRLPGYRRCYAADPAGNQLEFLQPA